MNDGDRSATGVRSSLVIHRCHYYQFKYRSKPRPQGSQRHFNPHGRDDRLPGLHEPLDDPFVRLDPRRGPRGQLPRSSRHLEQSGSSKFNESFLTEFEPGGHIGFRRFHANRSRRDPP